MRYISIFSGIEAASCAWECLGWEPVAFSEIEPFPCRVLAERFPDTPNLGDITKVDWSPYAGSVDLVAGGSPCQSFSVAGTRTGLSGESRLMWEWVRCVRETRPRFVLWENVPGALSSNHGEDLRCLFRELDELGYQFAGRCLDAQMFGVAQRRVRFFIAGYLGAHDARIAQQILFEPESLSGDRTPVREKRQALARHSGDRPDDPITFVDRCGRAGGGKGVLAQRDLASTLDCGTSQRLVSGFSYKASAGAGSVGFQPDMRPTLLAGRNDAAVCIDGAVARGARMNQNGKGWSDTGESYTLSTIDVPAVAVGTALNAGDPQSKRVFDPDGPAPTLNCATREGKGIVPSVLVGSLNGGGYDAHQATRVYGQDGTAPTLTAAAYVPQVLAISENVRGELRTSEVSGALAAGAPNKQGGRVLCTSNGEDVFPALCATDGDKRFLDNKSVRAGRLIMDGEVSFPVVRRLTPLECERLQGFPDGWTDLEGASDTARYKALGNSMAVPVMRWIGRRIDAVERLRLDPFDAEAAQLLQFTPVE